MVAERIRELGMHAEICSGEALDLIEAWSGADELVIVDAVVTGAPAGKLWLWDGEEVKTKKNLFVSTHRFGVAEAIELARVLHRLPKQLRVFGIEGRRFDFGRDLSPEVAHTVEELATLIAFPCSLPMLGLVLSGSSSYFLNQPRLRSPASSQNSSVALASLPDLTGG